MAHHIKDRYCILKNVDIKPIEYMAFETVESVKTDYYVNEDDYDTSLKALEKFYDFYNSNKEMEKRYKKKVDKEKDKERQALDIEKNNKNKQPGNSNKKELEL